VFSQNHYVPILKGRDGEYGALETLTPLVRQGLTPLLEMPPIPWDYEQDIPAKTIDQHLKKVGQKIQRVLGPGHRLFVDLPPWIPESERMSDGEHPLVFMFRSLEERAIAATPVIGLLRADDYIRACRNVINEKSRGVCVRIQREDFTDFDDVGSAIAGILDRVGAKVENADLIFDLRALTPDERNLDAQSVINYANRLPTLRQWRTFTIAATSFPQNLTGLPASNTSSVPRQEWTLWTNVVRSGKQLERIPTFGDYAISHPEPSEVDPRVMRPSASIRYTCDSTWLVAKARNLRDHGYAQFPEVCRELIQRVEYTGPQFSWGDRYIDDCAAGRVGTGNLTTWRKVGTSHHLAFAVHQLANRSAS
jgi:Beta protein